MYSKYLLYIGIIINCLTSAFGRTVIIADVHGDVRRFKNILQDARILDQKERWIAKPNTTVIQLGDQIDPKPVDKEDIPRRHHFTMIYYTDYLRDEAMHYGSEFISLIGNHEDMNIGKIRSKKILREIVANRPIIIKRDFFVFCHGGLKMAHHRILKDNNKTLEYINTLWHDYVNEKPMNDTERAILDVIILNKNTSILYSKSADTKKDTFDLLKIYSIEYMFIGHLMTNYIHVSNRIWYLDMLLNRAFHKEIYIAISS